MTYVALLRGVNVVGKNKVPMKELAEKLRGIGCGQVRTYIQSGNVVFQDKGKRRARDWAGDIAQSIQDSFGFTIPVVLRTMSEMQAVVNGNEFLRKQPAPEHLHVAFLDAPLAKGALDKEDEQRFAPDTFAVAGTNVYLWVPTGFGTSKLPAYLDRRFRTAKAIATVRNWRTTLQLTRMAEELERS